MCKRIAVEKLRGAVKVTVVHNNKDLARVIWLSEEMR
jgi:hypothetical protein